MRGRNGSFPHTNTLPVCYGEGSARFQHKRSPETTLRNISVWTSRSRADPSEAANPNAVKTEPPADELRLSRKLVGPRLAEKRPKNNPSGTSRTPDSSLKGPCQQGPYRPIQGPLSTSLPPWARRWSRKVGGSCRLRTSQSIPTGTKERVPEFVGYQGGIIVAF